MKTLQLLGLVLVITSTSVFAGEVRTWQFAQNPTWVELTPDGSPRGTTGFEIMFISDNSSFSCVTAVSDNLANCGKQVAKDCYALTRKPDYVNEKLGFKETRSPGQTISAMDVYDSANHVMCMITVGSDGEDGKCAHFDVKCIPLIASGDPAVRGTR